MWPPVCCSTPAWEYSRWGHWTAASGWQDFYSPCCFLFSVPKNSHTLFCLGEFLLLLPLKSSKTELPSCFHIVAHSSSLDSRHGRVKRSVGLRFYSMLVYAAQYGVAQSRSSINDCWIDTGLWVRKAGFQSQFRNYINFGQFKKLFVPELLHLENKVNNHLSTFLDCLTRLWEDDLQKGIFGKVERKAI